MQGPVIQDTTQFILKASVIDGVCTKEFDGIIQVNVEQVKADFYLSAMNAALNEPINLYNLSTGGTNFQWTFDGAASSSFTGATPAPVNFVQAGTLHPTLRASSNSGCADVATKSIYVYDNSLLKTSCWSTGIGLESKRGSGSFKNSSAFTPNGDVIITGSFSGTAEFDSKVGPDFKIPDEYYTTNFIARYSSKGVLKWAFNTSRYEYANSSTIVGSDVVVDDEGSIYLLTSDGSFEPKFYSANGATTNIDANDSRYYGHSNQYLIKYSPDGILQWARSRRQITGGLYADIFIDMELDPSGNIFIVSDHIYKISPSGDVLMKVSEVIAFNITNLPEDRSADVEVYPIPANDIITVIFSDADYINRIRSVSVVSVTGVQSLQVNRSKFPSKLEIDISRLPTGVYVSVIELPESVIHKKIIIH